MLTNIQENSAFQVLGMLQPILQYAGHPGSNPESAGVNAQLLPFNTAPYDRRALEHQCFVISHDTSQSDHACWTMPVPQVLLELHNKTEGEDRDLFESYCSVFPINLTGMV